MRTPAALSFPGLKAKACRTPGQAWENEQTDWGGAGSSATGPQVGGS